jgi:acyl-coenzyme A synthetase/AMP-(fatty) acid ligase
VRWTYQQLTSKVLSFAAALKDLGYKPGEKLCMALDNGAPNIVAQLAAAVVGADVVPALTDNPEPCTLC